MSKTALLILKKESGVTSFASLSSVKRYFKGEKVGHAGTLDKFASGLMLVLVGRATKLNPIFSSLDKTYIATVKFGIETDTLDPEGEVIKTGHIPTREEIEAVLPSFLGKQEQVPPVYSALHVNGKRAYELARSGKDVEMQSRPINIYTIKLLDFKEDEAVIELRVSKGTYIRSFARDLGYKLGTCASLSALERTTIGPYSYDDISNFDTACEATIPLLLKMSYIKKIEVRRDAIKKLQNGLIPYSFTTDQMDEDAYYLALYNGNLIAILEKCGKKISIAAQGEPFDADL